MNKLLSTKLFFDMTVDYLQTSQSGGMRRVLLAVVDSIIWGTQHYERDRIKTIIGILESEASPDAAAVLSLLRDQINELPFVVDRGGAA